MVSPSHIDLPFDGAEEKPDELPGSPDGLDMDLQDCAIVGVCSLVDRNGSPVDGLDVCDCQNDIMSFTFTF